jgi:putative peptidoglycan lipid II flippase
MCSRVLGLVREVVFGMLLRRGKVDGRLHHGVQDAQTCSRDLFAEGALSTAFITTFSKKIGKEGEPAAWRLANKVGSLLLWTMTIVGSRRSCCSRR